MGNPVAMFFGTDVFLRAARAVAPHCPVAAVVMGEVGVLMHPGSALVADIAENGMLRVQSGQIFEIDISGIFR